MNGHAFSFRDKREELGKFLLAVIVFLAAFMLETKLAVVLPITPNFLLAALIALTFFLGFGEMLFLGLIAALFLNYQPEFRTESLLVAALPLVVAVVRRFAFPFAGWLSNFFCTATAIFLLYCALNFAESFRSPGVLAADIALSSIFGFLIFCFFRYGYSETLR